MIYKQGVQCWVQTLTGCSFHECATSKTRLGTLSSQSSLRLATQHVHCKVPCNVQPLKARSPHTSRTMRRTTPRTTLSRCSTRTAAPMRRNVSSSLKHTQQHNGTLVPARVPIPCPFGQVASMRNQRAHKNSTHFQTQRAKARHRPTFPHTNCSTIPFTVVFKAVLHWSVSRLSKTSASLFQFNVHQQSSCAQSLARSTSSETS